MGVIAWVDIETTGLDEFQDPILEVAFVVTTQRPIRRITSGEWLICPPDLEGAIAKMPDRVLQMHTDNGLIDDLRAGKGRPRDEVDLEIATWIRRSTPGRGGQISYGGSGVERFESKFLPRQLPQTWAALHYAGYDVGSARRIMGLSGAKPPEIVSVASAGNHRAMSDIDQHIAETEWFVKLYSDPRVQGVILELGGTV